MNKKGFTLVELLAVIVVLAIILAIAVPGISGIIKNSTKSSMQSDAKLLLKAVDLKKLGQNDFNPLDYNGNLSGLLSALGLNGDNYESIVFTNNNGKILITVTGKGRWKGLTACGSYQNMQVSDDGCELDLIPPVINLIGDNPMSISMGSNYEEPGADVSDNSGETLDLTISGTVDINILGTYTITYRATDSSSNTTIVTRIVNVIDSVPPVIEMLGTNPVVLFVGMTYVDAGATATDNLDGDVTANIVTVNNVNSSVEGNYTVTYDVVDSAGNAVQAVRNVMIKSNIFNFTNAGATGRTGPDQTQVNVAYASTSLDGMVTSSGGIQLWTVPVTGNYTIETRGAQGGTATSYYSGTSGAVIIGTFALTEGTQLKILVGQQGLNNQYAGGGGGGTFVTNSSNSPLIVAGGGAGGSGKSSTLNSPSVSTSGNAGHGAGTWAGGAGGTGGNGGAMGHAKNGGGGLISNGGGTSGGISFNNGGTGGPAGSNGGVGGFGGGGGGAGSGGAGGGYSGGGGGGWLTGDWGNHCSGGGGGSYNAGSNQSNSAGSNSGHGKVVIKYIP